MPALIEGLGYTRGPDGGFRSPESGQRLAVEIRAGVGLDIQQKSLFSVTDYWQRLGLAAEPVVVPTQRALDREWVANFPASYLYRQPNDLNSVKRYHGSQSRIAEKNYVGNNYNRYMNPEYDALIDRFLTTIPRSERIHTLGQIVHQMTDQVLLMGLFYDTEATMISNRLSNVAKLSRSNMSWNAHEWELR